MFNSNFTKGVGRHCIYKGHKKTRATGITACIIMDPYMHKWVTLKL